MVDFAHKTLRATMVELAMTERGLAMRLREESMPRPFRWEEMPINETRHRAFSQLEALRAMRRDRTSTTSISCKKR